jgi:hypothetical protein
MNLTNHDQLREEFILLMDFFIPKNHLWTGKVEIKKVIFFNFVPNPF